MNAKPAWHPMSDRKLAGTILHPSTIMTTTTPAGWQNTGAFGPEQANLDVSYATSLPPDAALAWVEARLLEVQSHFANLGTRRNNLFPIYHFPKDVLFQILSWVAFSHASSELGEDPYPSYPFHADQTQDLVHLSQACKLFRSAALERPELWVRVNLRYLTLAKMFLERSGDRLVTVCLHARSTYISPPITLKASMLEILRPHLGRIADLDLTYTTQTPGCSDENPLAMHMPALRTLRLHNVCKARLERARDTVDSDTQPIPSPVLPTPNDPYPRLRTVALVSLDVPWDSPLLNGLTELELSNQDLDHAPKIEEFVTVLEQCPGLEKLQLWNSGPKGPAEPLAAPDVKKVQLSHLRDLSIIQDEGRCMDISLLLSRVSIPSSTKIHIQCNEAVDPIVRFSQIFPPGHPFLQEMPKYETLKHLHSFTFFHFRLIDEPSGGSLSFRVNRHDQTVQTSTSIVDFFQAFGETIRHVEIYPATDNNPWAEILGSLPNTETMKIKRDLDFSRFIVSLSLPACTKLKKLSFEYYTHTAEHQSAWLSVVEDRANNGMKLEELSLSFSQGDGLLTDDVVDEFRLHTDKFSHEKVRTQF